MDPSKHGAEVIWMARRGRFLTLRAGGESWGGEKMPLEAWWVDTNYMILLRYLYHLV